MKKALFILIIISFSRLSFAEFPAVEVYQKNSKAVVLIISRDEDNASKIGAGSIISRSGMVATNAHVIIGKSKSRPLSDILIFLKPDNVTGNFKKDLVNRHKAKVISYDIDLDLAVLQVDDIPFASGIIELANPEEIKIGEEAVAIGHPEQGGLWSLTYGRISGEIENQSDIHGKDVFQTDASVNRGNSGGPLLDKRGYMIGINSNIARVGADDLAITGVNFAVKSSVLQKWLNKNGYIIAYGKESLMKEEKRAVSMSSEKDIPSPAGESKTGQDEPVAKPAEKAEEKDNQSGNIKKEPPQIKEPEKNPERKFETPKKPYNYDALFKAVEEDLENMMEEMKGKIRR